MSVIYMIRHGQASFGQSHYDRLSDQGRRQSEILGEFLLRQGVRFDHIYMGTLQRQIDTAEQYLARIAAVRAAVPDIALSTDIIVGFPGETEDDFLQSQYRLDTDDPARLSRDELVDRQEANDELARGIGGLRVGDGVMLDLSIGWLALTGPENAIGVVPVMRRL